MALPTAFKPTWVKAKYKDPDISSNVGDDMLTFVVDCDNERYCSNRDDATVVQTIATAEGPIGRNCDYLYQLVEHLQELGYNDPEMTDLAKKVRTYQDQQR